MSKRSNYKRVHAERADNTIAKLEAKKNQLTLEKEIKALEEEAAAADNSND